MRSRHLSHLLLFLPCLVVLTMLIAFASTTRNVDAAATHVDVTTINSDIGPASLRLLTRAIDTAEHDGARALVVEIDTPGGDIDSMKAMTQEELASSVPVIAYVSPIGGRAASAGAFVTLAAHVAAMAPTTRIGASSPVTGSGGDIGSTLKSKIENDLIASITGIQTRYGRNVSLAVSMVTQAASYDDVAALKGKIVDARATDLPTLLNMVNGRVVKLNSGRSVTLQTAGTSIQTVDANALDAFYALLLDPNVVFLLFIVAMLGIYLEIAHPGAILPGVTGAIALLLFLFAAGSLTPNWAGLALMLLAAVLLVLDVKLPTHGVLTLGAVISLIVGALLFFNSGGPYSGTQLNPVVVYIVAGIVGLVGLMLVAFIVRARRMRVTTGVEGMIGATVIARTPLLPEGRVSYSGEDWAAVLDAPTAVADPGSRLQIVSVEGLRLHVQLLRPGPIVDVHSVSSFK
ncbi:MAG: nodulation protein NfeD [Ktedonobacteraceae bacterium]